MVDKITILGLLVSHASRFCIPLQYDTHVNGKSSILKGDEMLFDEAIGILKGDEMLFDEAIGMIIAQT